ncbi:hypothetical protein Nepgr_008552 [Nepenthes gracilis]|uniref:Uncharacterized protein n=1 Tax=Nepenthes gracilis TaxID=150966 RepID=A0AAD3S946_NEPGR|nr:hypothetical protein Nepgr_008552 [Nepenthes gracilis]
MSSATRQHVNGRDDVVAQYVDSSTATQLLCKFRDNSAFGFDYSQSALWSPLVHRFPPIPYGDDNNWLMTAATPPKTPRTNRKLRFDKDHKLFERFSLSKIKKKIATMVSLNKSLQKKKSLKFTKGSSDSPCTPSSNGKGWGKIIKATSKQFKKKKKKKDPTIHVKLSDFLRSENF